MTQSTKQAAAKASFDQLLEQKWKKKLISFSLETFHYKIVFVFCDRQRERNRKDFPTCMRGIYNRIKTVGLILWLFKRDLLCEVRTEMNQVDLITNATYMGFSIEIASDILEKSINAEISVSFFATSQRLKIKM